jgi:acyl-CoA thioesterase-1
MLKRAVFIAFFTIAGFDAVSAQIVALGASNTAGKGVGSSDAFPAQVEVILRAQGRPMSVSNAGINGDTTAGMLSRLSRSVPDGTKYVILQFGGNDARGGKSPAERKTNIASINQQLKARGIKIIHADGFVRTALQSGMRQADGIHLTVEGHRRVAQQIAAAIQ